VARQQGFQASSVKSTTAILIEKDGLKLSLPATDDAALCKRVNKALRLYKDYPEADSNPGKRVKISTCTNHGQEAKGNKRPPTELNERRNKAEVTCLDLTCSL
jgi:hypothetical protein